MLGIKTNIAHKGFATVQVFVRNKKKLSRFFLSFFSEWECADDEKKSCVTNNGELWWNCVIAGNNVKKDWTYTLLPWKQDSYMTPSLRDYVCRDREKLLELLLLCSDNFPRYLVQLWCQSCQTSSKNSVVIQQSVAKKSNHLAFRNKYMYWNTVQKLLQPELDITYTSHVVFLSKCLG